MQDYYLKTNTEQELWNCLVSLDLAVWNDEIDRFIPKGINLDIIGTIYKPTGETQYIGEGFQHPIQVPVMVSVAGFHANIRADLTEEQQARLPLVPAPLTPSRVWA
jgi:hypothetical protein